MIPRYKKRFETDRFLGQYGRFDLFADESSKAIVARFGNSPIRGEIAIANGIIKHGDGSYLSTKIRTRHTIRWNEPGSLDDLTFGIFQYGLSLLNGDDDPSISPGAR